MLIYLLLGGTAVAGGVVGVEYVPPGLGEMAWVSSEQLSGSLVAERDGILTPPLRSFGGYAWGRNAVTAGFAVARIATTVVTTDNEATSTRMAVRPSVDYRRWFMDPVPNRPLFFVAGGLYGVVPFAAEAAEGASTEDRAALAEAAKQARGRIGAIGGSLGIGAEVRWDNGLGLGIRSSVVVHRSQSSNQETQTVSSLIRPETALSLSFWF